MSPSGADRVGRDGPARRGQASTLRSWKRPAQRSGPTCDAQGRLISAATATHAVSPVYDGRNPTSSRAARNYAATRGIDEILRREAGRSTVFYHHDALGSTIALTDDSGALVEQYRYDVYGLPTVLDASGTPSTPDPRTSPLGNRFLFTGREWLSDLGLYDYRHRAYSPTLGRWLQPDPITFSGRGDIEAVAEALSRSGCGTEVGQERRCAG